MEQFEKIKVYTRLLRTGQTLVSPAIDKNGLLLAGEGTTINEKNLYLLKSSGIEVVEVEKTKAFKWQVWQPEAEKKRAIKEKVGRHKSRYMRILEKALLDKMNENKNIEGDKE